jgi:hypothetical protein
MTMSGPVTQSHRTNNRAFEVYFPLQRKRMNLKGTGAAFIIAISASVVNAQDVVVSFWSQAMQMSAEQCADWRSQTLAGLAANANESVQPSEWAACVDAQTQSTLAHLRASATHNMTKMEEARMDAYADCHFPAKFDAHAYWQWVEAFQHRTTPYDVCTASKQ